jgi:very-short-patch-repair endonuclease
VTQAIGAWDARLGVLTNLLSFDATRRFGPDATLGAQPFAVIDGLLRSWSASPDSISDMVAFNTSADLLRAEGLDEVASVARTWADAPRHLVDALRKGRATLLLERAVQERPALAHFDVGSHQQVIERFRDLDQLGFRANRARLAYAHWSMLPTHEAGGQLGVLRREFEKKSRHLPVRRLMERAGNAVQAIKPIFMMSPLSIATYVSPGTLNFDLVIFDEASQVKPVDAFGALLRGQQAVVVGDSKQLPPTSFFDRMMDSVDDDDEGTNVTADLESVLGLFSAQSAPSRMLRWHYRSRHESLIAVSNHEFYENRLIIVPSPDASRSEAGLHYHYLPDTAYDRGGTRTNKDEALAVAQAVMEHARTSPHLTLGVAAFSVSQTDAILAQLEVLRRADPSCEAFFSAHPEEPFFVKNLENVQGDERDVIFISVGYGRTADGYVAMSFGPLNNDGGERRLNVLITRARLRCEVFTNLTADDIDLNRSNARGVHALKQFLKYAQTGVLDMPTASGKPSDSPFEDAVRDALEAAGYTVEGQVGSAGFFIDLAVIDPLRPGRYLLGIECDGATYHSARSARDRDRLRQQVLEGLGWRIHRVWSTDWFRNPEREMKRLVAAIEQAQAAGGPDIPDPVSRGTTIERVESEPPTPATSGNPYRLAMPRVNLNGLDLHQAPPGLVAQWVVDVVRVESPVHVDEVTHRIASAAGVSRVGSRIRRTLDAGIDAAIAGGQVRRQGAFLWSSDMQTPLVRDRSAVDGSPRAADRVAPEEIEQAIEQAVRDAYGMEPTQIASAAWALLGFARVTEDMRSATDGLVDDLLASGRLLAQGPHLVVP